MKKIKNRLKNKIINMYNIGELIFISVVVIGIIMVAWHHRFKKQYNGTAQLSYTMSEDEITESKKKQRVMLDYMKRITKPNGKTIIELESILISNYGAKRMEIDANKLRTIKMLVIMNRVLELPKTDNLKKLNASIFEDRRKEAHRLLEGGIDLDVVVYKFGEVDGNGQIPILELERNYSYMTMSNGSRQLWNSITAEYGVFQEDIDNETDRFIGYSYAVEARENND